MLFLFGHSSVPVLHKATYRSGFYCPEKNRLVEFCNVFVSAQYRRRHATTYRQAGAETLFSVHYLFLSNGPKQGLGGFANMDRPFGPALSPVLLLHVFVMCCLFRSYSQLDIHKGTFHLYQYPQQKFFLYRLILLQEK